VADGGLRDPQTNRRALHAPFAQHRVERDEQVEIESAQMNVVHVHSVTSSLDSCRRPGPSSRPMTHPTHSLVRLSSIPELAILTFASMCCSIALHVVRRMQSKG